MNVYYEFKYPVKRNKGIWIKTGLGVNTRDISPGIYKARAYYIGGELTGVTTLMYQANRVWVVKNGVVSWAKNRYHGGEDPVDMEEFMWVKLQAKEL